MKKQQGVSVMYSMSFALLLLPFTPGSGTAADWSYSGDNGPESWGDLDPAYHTCKDGTKQSPIDLANAEPTKVAELVFHYQASALDAVNNGHTIQVNYDDGAGKLMIDGEEYKLLQFHFHAPSEHTVIGTQFPMEVHFVHVNHSGELAVVGVLMESGARNGTVQRIWDAEAGKKKNVGKINARSLFAANRHEFKAYKGSLTTPPCSEGVRWFVMEDTIHVSHEQVEHFMELFHGATNRPVQPLYERTVFDNVKK